MKITISILILVILAVSEALPEQNTPLKFYKPLIRKLEKKFNADPAGITAEINDFIDELFKNLGKYAVKHHLDPVPLGNISEKFLVASITLTNGSLHGISTIKRYDDAMVTYKHKYRTLSVTLPIIFSNLSFTYNYHALVLGVGPKGEMIGAIKNFKFYITIDFNFLTYAASIENLKTTDSGHISVTFSGNLTDFIFNILSQFVTTILHPILQGVIEGIIKLYANKIVDNVNDLIYNILHPNNTYNIEYSKFVPLKLS